MQFSKRTMALAACHFTVMLWGITAILGKLITYSSFPLVWHRMFITAVVYLMIPSFWIGVKTVPWRQIGIYLGIGVLISFHWILFYGSIKFGDSASIALACLGSTGFFSSFVEPLILKSKFSIQNTLLGCMVIVGILLIYFSLPGPDESGTTASQGGGISASGERLAVITGVASALLASIFTVLNKMNVDEAPTIVMATLEMTAGAIFLTFLVPILYGKETIWYPQFNPYDLSLATIRLGPWDLIWVLILAVFCTNLTFYLSNWSLSHVSAFTATLIWNLEPIYGIILGALIFHENKDLNNLFYIGTTVIVCAIFLGPIIQYFQDRRESDAQLLPESDSPRQVGDIELEDLEKDLGDSKPAEGRVDSDSDQSFQYARVGTTEEE